MKSESTPKGKKSEDLHISLHIDFRAQVNQSPKTGYTVFLQILNVVPQIRANKSQVNTFNKQRSSNGVAKFTAFDIPIDPLGQINQN